MSGRSVIAVSLHHKVHSIFHTHTRGVFFRRNRLTDKSSGSALSRFLVVVWPPPRQLPPTPAVVSKNIRLSSLNGSASGFGAYILQHTLTSTAIRTPQPGQIYEAPVCSKPTDWYKEAAGRAEGGHPLIHE